MNAHKMEETPGTGHDAPIAMAVLLGLVALAVLFWMHPFITAGAVAAVVFSEALREHVGHFPFHGHAVPHRHTDAPDFTTTTRNTKPHHL